MKKGFTLLELVIVIIIIGVLATLGIQQYGRVVERSRGAEARTILGQIRMLAAAHYMEYNCLDNSCTGASGIQFTAARATIGTGEGLIPGACVPTHYFFYSISVTSPTAIEMIATRCGGGASSGGKVPDAPTGIGGQTLTLTSTFGISSTGDRWGGSGDW